MVPIQGTFAQFCSHSSHKGLPVYYKLCHEDLLLANLAMIAIILGCSSSSGLFMVSHGTDLIPSDWYVSVKDIFYVLSENSHSCLITYS